MVISRCATARGRIAAQVKSIRTFRPIFSATPTVDPFDTPKQISLTPPNASGSGQSPSVSCTQTMGSIWATLTKD